MAKTASYPVISLGLDASGITKGLAAARNILKTGMSSLSSAISTPLFGVALANQAAEFGGKISRLFGEPFRQLMAQEDMSSRFSVLAGGTDKAGKALDQFKGISRETGISLGEMSNSLDNLLQGEFSFAGAVAQIEDLSKVASILGEGSLPMLTQAAAKFRANAFAGFADLNSLAQTGLPVFDALAQQLGVTADEARKLAKDGLVTGLQARSALNKAADMGVGANGGQKDQSLSGVVSRLREGLNQTLAAFGNAVAKVINVQALLEKFRGFVGVVQTLLEQAFGPMKNVVGGDGGNLKRAFADAQAVTIDIFKKIGEGFFKFLEGLEKVTNGMVKLFNWVSSWIPGANGFNGDQQKLIDDQMKAAKNIPLGEDVKRQAIIAALQKEGKLPQEVKFGEANFGIGKMRADFNNLMAGAGNAMGGPAKELDAAGQAAAKAAENLAQARQALEGLGESVTKQSITDPFENAKRQLALFNMAFNDAVNQGVGDPQALWEKNQGALAAIGKQFSDAADSVLAPFRDVKLADMLSTGSTDAYKAVAKQLSSSNIGSSPQERVPKALEIIAEINRKQLKAGQEAIKAIQNIPAGQGVMVVGFN